MADNKVIARSIPRFQINLKLGKKTLAVMGLGIVAIAAVGVLGYRNQQIAEQKTLEEELTVVQNRLAALGLDELHVQYASITSQIDQAKTQIHELKAQVGVPINSIETSDKLFAIAQKSGVKITNIVTIVSSPSELLKVPVDGMPVTLELQGELVKLVDYLSVLKTDFLTGYVDDVSFVISADEPATLSTATINMMIYTYREN
ncbi:MAG: hypothetical protein PHE50_00455 [Dehalococcoidales bacterium]|nr:hypothetical protein [Dehalococcoidales bacterium]